MPQLAGFPPRNRTPRADDEASAFESLLHEVQALPASGLTRGHVIELLRRFAGTRVYIPRRWARHDVVQAAAARMLRSGTPRALIAQTLRETYGLGRSQAYAVIRRALNHQPRSTPC